MMSPLSGQRLATQSSRLKNYKTETPYKQWRRAFQNFLEAMLGAVRDRYVQNLGSLLQAKFISRLSVLQVFFFFFFLEFLTLPCQTQATFISDGIREQRKIFNPVNVIHHASNYNII